MNIYRGGERSIFRSPPLYMFIIYNFMPIPNSAKS